MHSLVAIGAKVATIYHALVVHVQFAISSKLALVAILYGAGSLLKLTHLTFPSALLTSHLNLHALAGHPPTAHGSIVPTLG